jgi:hypothetical protein
VASIRRPARRSLALVISTICALVALFGLTANAGAVTRSGGTGTDPWIASELPDYAPGSVVNLLGGSWQPGEAVHIAVNDNEGQTWVRGVDVTADSNGDISDTFTLPNWFIATYGVIATGATGSVATTSFTDGNLSSVSGTVRDSVTLAAISGATLTCNTASGCNNTFTTTTDASGSYSFAGANKLSFAGNGPVTLTLNVAKAGYTTGTITLGNVSNGDTLTGRNIALVPSGPTKLGFTTSAFTGAVGACLGPITVQTQNASGTATNVTSTATVNLSTDAGGTGAGAFYSDSSCSAAITSGTIAAGSSSTSFYYSATGRGGGSHQLTASAAGLTSALQTETITKADQATVSITSPSSMTYGDPDATIGVSGGSGTGVVTFDTGASTACAIVSGKLHVVAGAGTCSIIATKAGDANYNPTTSAAHGVDVNRRDLTVTAHGLNKIYDGTTSATVTLTTDKLADDTVSAAYTSASFSNRHVGTGKTVSVSGISISGADASNYNLTNTTAATGADITSRPITIAAVTDSKVYDGTTGSDETPVLAVGAYASGDTPAFAQAYASKSVGTGKTLVPSGSVSDGNGGDNYAVTFVNDTTGEITAKELSVSFGADSKTYDGTTAATIKTSPAPSLVGTIGGDDVTLDSSGASADFDSKTAGAAKTVSGSGFTKSGADAGNYVFAVPQGTTTADIAAKGLTIDGAAADDKTYDGTASATVDFDGASLAGVVSGDDVSIDHTGYSASFADKQVGADKPVTVTGVMLSGGDAVNYSVSQPSGLKADIAAKGLTITGTSADDKTYDGSPSATVDFSGASLAGVVSGDDVAIDHSGYSAWFANKNVGTGKPVTVNGVALSGADSGNYAVGQPSGLEADITPLAISGSFDSADKVYDGTVAASATNRQLSGVLGSDDVSLSGGTAGFDTKNVGTGKPVSLSGAALVGADKDNYSLSSVAGAHADITQRDLTVTAHGVDRTYDGTTDATVTLSSDKLAGDSVSAAYTSAAFASKHAGPGRSVGVSGISISGADAGNYHLLNASGSTSAEIFKRSLSVRAVADTKVYDGTTGSDETPTVSSGTIASGDTADFSQAYATRTVGSGKTLIPSGSVLDGNGGDNYAVAFLNVTDGVITAKNLTVSGITAGDKPFDGNTSATLNVSAAALVGVVSGDVVTIGTGAASGAFTSSVPGTCTVQVSGLSIAGADSANYTLTHPVVAACIGAWYATGFYAPVGIGNSQLVTSPGAPPTVSPVSTTWNIAKGGSTIPLKFNLYTSPGGAERANIADIRSFDAVKLSCTTGEGEAAVDFITTGNTSLRYDGSQFIQNWKTPSSSTDTCYRASVKFQDGSAIYAFFKLRK